MSLWGLIPRDYIEGGHYQMESPSRISPKDYLKEGENEKN